MDSKNVTRGVKVTYIETQFVTSDAAGFKDLVQRLTGRSAPLVPPPAPHRPFPCRPDNGRPRGTTAAGPLQGYHRYTAAEEVRPPVTISRTPPSYLQEDGMGLHDFIDVGDFSDVFCVAGASDGSDGCYGGFPY